MPPPASTRKAWAAWPTEKGSAPNAAASRIEKTTTPTPSLNRLSPATVACSVGGTAARFNTPMTATGSVGLISAPNTKHQIGGHAKAERTGQRPEAAADDQGREQHADRAQHEDRPAPAPHLAPVDMERAGEEQEGEHALHQRGVKIDAGEEGGDLLGKVACRQQPVEADHDQRRDRAHHREADRCRQPKVAVVEITEHRRQDDQDRRGIERAKGRCVHFNSRAEVAFGLMAPDNARRNQPCGCIDVAGD